MNNQVVHTMEVGTVVRGDEREHSLEGQRDQVVVAIGVARFVAGMRVHLREQAQPMPTRALGGVAKRVRVE
jgi:hypothetical protein